MSGMVFIRFLKGEEGGNGEGWRKMEKDGEGWKRMEEDGEG